jgi:hypothetical protein
MYFPYLRGKQFEIEALIEAPHWVYQNALPIIEPINITRRRFSTLASRNIPYILITNPYHPQNNRLSTASIQNMIDTELASFTSILLGFIVDTRFNTANLNSFLNSNMTRRKALIFRYSPQVADLSAIRSALSVNPVDYIIFDDRKVNNTTRNAFSANTNIVLITDGFQRQDKNSDYPVSSDFESNFSSWRTSGLVGIGDYLTIGDHFQEGGGQVYVVSLHVTVQTPTGLEVRHFSSTFDAAFRGFAAQKFAEANTLLVSSPTIVPLNSVGLDIYRDLHARSHNPQLGVAKKASIIRHIELMSSIV